MFIFLLQKIIIYHFVAMAVLVVPRNDHMNRFPVGMKDPAAWPSGKMVKFGDRKVKLVTWPPDESNEQRVSECHLMRVLRDLRYFPADISALKWTNRFIPTIGAEWEGIQTGTLGFYYWTKLKPNHGRYEPKPHPVGVWCLKGLFWFFTWFFMAYTVLTHDVRDD